MRRLVLALTVSLALVLVGPAAAQASWGAIAVDPETGRYGVSFDYGSVNAAKNRARNECGGGSHCRIAAWVFNGYAALVQKKNGVYFAGIGRTENKAKKSARRHAHDSGARLITTVFSGFS